MLGTLGHISIIVSLVFAGLACYAYFKATQTGTRSWMSSARVTFFIHATGVLTALLCLLFILFQHQYQYQYAWQHSSNDLPVYFLISCLWEGQEGSFLLWIFWNVIIGIILVKKANEWEAPVMMIFLGFQCLLTLMVLGVFIDPLDTKIGSSPFIPVKNTFGTIPTDGNGLNPLLQNIWMVIHPPTIFLGYALTAVPFSYCVAGLVKGLWTTWLKPAFVWLLASTTLLGMGIVMGAYWAYETLNFGGYWNWDPVENAVYVPWLILIAATHSYSLFRKKKKGLKVSFILTACGFISILYSTFLTRSGVLGNSSVHSFTDLGLSGQLVFILIFTGLGTFLLMSANWRKLPPENNEPGYHTPEFWIFVAIAVLCLAAFQVILPTSIPVFNEIAEVFGVQSNMAPPADQVSFYTKFQLWFAVAFGLLSGIAQILHWKRSNEKFEDILTIPLVSTLILGSVIILLSGIGDWKYITLLTTSLFGMLVCIRILFRLYKQLSYVNVGGLIAHTGMSVLLIGILYSAGRSSMLSRNLIVKSDESGIPDHQLMDHVLLTRQDTKNINGIQLKYEGKRLKIPKQSVYGDADYLLPTNVAKLRVTEKPIFKHGQLVVRAGDTVEVEPENVYYEVSLFDENGRHSLFPRMQQNPSMGYIASPAIRTSFSDDIYSHITNFPDPEKLKWSEPTSFNVRPGDTLQIHSLLIILNHVETRTSPGISLVNGDLPIQATFDITDLKHNVHYEASSLFLVRNGNIRLYTDEIEALGVKLWLKAIDIENGEFTVAASFSQRDWIAMQIIRMPHINLVWIGSILIILGFLFSISHRLRKTEKVKTIPASPDEVVLQGPEIHISPEHSKNTFV